MGSKSLIFRISRMVKRVILFCFSALLPVSVSHAAMDDALMNGLFWNHNESGWGVNLVRQYQIVFATFFAYDSSGMPTWYVASNCAVVGNGCSGELYEVVAGSELTGPWNGDNLSATPVGDVTFSFTDNDNGEMTFDINGVNGTKVIERQIWATADSQPLDNGKWVVDSSTNPLDDTPTVIVYLRADTGTNKWGDPIYFFARCSSNTTEVFIAWDVYLGSASLGDEAVVTTRIDDATAVTSNWWISTANDASFHKTAETFLNQLLNSTQLVAQVTPYSDSPITAIFDTSGLVNAIIPLREACGW